MNILHLNYSPLKMQQDSLDGWKRRLILNQMPERFREYTNEPWHIRGLRLMPVDNYCVLYIPNIEKAVVYIVRIMYCGSDIDTQLNNYTKDNPIA